MSERPYPGDTVEMAAMGDDVRIEIKEVFEEQPLVRTDGVFIVADQYGDEHLVEKNGDDWTTTTSDALSDEGFDLWAERAVGDLRI